MDTIDPFEVTFDIAPFGIDFELNTWRSNSYEPTCI